MSLYLTGAASSRIRKPSNPSRRNSSSPFGSASRTKPSTHRPKSVARALEGAVATVDDDEEKLDATGNILTVVPSELGPDVEAAVQHARATMFDPIPERAGMNSVRIAEVLNFQRNLPAVVTLTHIHALIAASSKTERQISALQSDGQIRKIKVVGRGSDMSGISEVVITMAAVQDLLQRSDIAPDVVTSFCDLLRENPRATSVVPHHLPPAHVTALTRTGFLVSSSLTGGNRNLSLAGSSLVSMPRVSRAASGTAGAVGGDSAFENLGGVGAARRADTGSGRLSEMAISVPNVGPYLRLLEAGRTHLLELLSKSKYREAPLYLLRERWDGAVDSDSRVSAAKRLRGEFSDILPAKTKKWKSLFGLRFDWTLEECLGAGLIELFETHSVGLGVRALT